MADSVQPGNRSAFPIWEREYKAALAEANPLLLGEKIYAAETALRKRRQELKDGAEDYAEIQAIAAALTALQNLQTKVFGPSDWQT